MAQLSGTQTKQKKTFIALVVAIVVVAVAITFVLYGELTSRSSLLENQDFAAALSDNLGKAPAFLKESDLAAVKYLGVSYQSETVQVITGGNEFTSQYLEYLDKIEADEDVSGYDLTKLVKISTFEAKEAPKLDDIKFFTGVEVLEVSGVTVSDSTIFSGMTSLVNGSVTGCELTEVKGFAGLNAETVKELNLSSNNVEDWSPLDYIKDKVIVSASYMLEPSEDGAIDFNNFTYVEQTLTEYYEKQAEKAEDEANKEAEGEDAADNNEDEPADADDKPTDEVGTSDSADAPTEGGEDAAA